MTILHELVKKVHSANMRWWTDSEGTRINRNRGELLMLVITEFAEACEGIRKNLMDDKLPHRKMEEVEMADAFIRLLDFCGGFGLDVYDAEFFDNMPTNKGEALLYLSSLVIRCESGYAAKEVSETLAAIREYCRLHDLDLMGAMHEKLAFNATREDHTHEARAKEGGKKF